MTIRFKKLKKCSIEVAEKNTFFEFLLIVIQCNKFFYLHPRCSFLNRDGLYIALSIFNSKEYRIRLIVFFE